MKALESDHHQHHPKRLWHSLSRQLFPILLCFCCISLFLFLAFMIIEGYSISRLVSSDRILSVYSVSNQ